ncbi:hypothetical protein MHF_0473 [Mycoplasma haemofelis Ohio2]|uniref:Uncharacterized protein n=1 Tax=Mycoplasma haemofelis (strain Ohio2) TaxID=859194 RepID=F6FHK6_MYCHI|nr:hypothetical protein MHF_0473 [Mycoplasma haemofelis Ohio2]
MALSGAAKLALAGGVLGTGSAVAGYKAFYSSSSNLEKVKALGKLTESKFTLLGKGEKSKWLEILKKYKDVPVEEKFSNLNISSGANTDNDVTAL